MAIDSDSLHYFTDLIQKDHRRRRFAHHFLQGLEFFSAATVEKGRRKGENLLRNLGKSQENRENHGKTWENHGKIMGKS